VTGPASTRTTVERLYEAYGRHEAEEAAALYVEAGRHEEAAQGRVSEGREAIASGLRAFFDAFPDARWEPRRWIVDGPEAAVAYLLTGTLTGRLGPFEPHGQRLELRGVHLFRVGAGGIEQSEDYWDAATFGRQMSAG
jgi:steroid delta-isomerase-like uncharacterized protein